MTLAPRKADWVRGPIAERTNLLRLSIAGALEVAEEWGRAAAEAKGIPADSPQAGEEWISGPMTPVRNLQLFAEAPAAARDPARSSQALPARPWPTSARGSGPSTTPTCSTILKSRSSPGRSACAFNCAGSAITKPCTRSGPSWSSSRPNRVGASSPASADWPCAVRASGLSFPTAPVDHRGCRPPCSRKTDFPVRGRRMRAAWHPGCLGRRSPLRSYSGPG